MNLRTILIAALAVLAFGAVTADAAKSPTIKSVNKTAKKALSAAQDAQHDVTAFGKQQEKVTAAQDDDIAAARREAQTANGRVTALPPTFKDNQVHEYAGFSEVAPDTAETVVATCPGDQSVVSGGYAFNTNQSITTPQPQIVEEFAEDNAWHVRMNNVGGLTSVELDVFAYCVPR